MTRFVVNNGKGTLVEIHHQDDDTGTMAFFVSPKLTDHPQYKLDTRMALEAAGLEVGNTDIGARSDFVGRDMLAVAYKGTLDQAKSAVSGNHDFVDQPDRLMEITHKERVDLKEKHWGRKDDEFTPRREQSTSPQFQTR